MERILWNDFSGGWVTDDAPVGGRQNTVQDLTNLNIDLNGDIQLCFGTAVYENTTRAVHSIFVTDKFRYWTDVAGNLERNSTLLSAGGSTTKTAYGRGLGYVLMASAGIRLKDNSTHTYNLGLLPPVIITTGVVGGGVLTGTYLYAAINVLSDGTYVGKSILGPTKSQATAAQNVTIAFGTAPNVTEPQTTETWIFRQIGGIWYRVLVVNAGSGWAGTDSMTDVAAQTLGIIFNTNLVSIASSGITDDILDIVGPINGRWYYFTNNFMYPSDINNPDLVDASLAIRTGSTGSGLTINEYFCWAHKISDSVVMVGTTHDCYTITGTFVTNPDFTIDIYYRPLSIPFPPITWGSDVYKGVVYYTGWDGVRAVTANSECVSVTNKYIGNTYYPAQARTFLNSVNVPIAVANDSLYVSKVSAFGFTTQSVDCWEFSRQYWRTMNYNLSSYTMGGVTAMCTGDDGVVYACFNGDFKIRAIDYALNRNYDGDATKEIPFSAKTVFMGGINPLTIKDVYDLNCRIYFETAHSNGLTLSVTDDTGTNTSVYANTTTVGVAATQQPGILNSNIPITSRTFYYITVLAQGTGAKYFRMASAEVTYDERPEGQTRLKLYQSDFGSASKKRIRVWPFVLDCLGGTVTFTPTVDGSNTTASTFGGSGKTTYFHFFKTDVFGVDYGGLFTCSTPFIYYNELPPEIVQILPIAKQFDQLGPVDLFKYGRIDQFDVRLLAFGTSIPYILYFNDNSQITGTLVTISGKEASYYINLPKNTAGQILRLELGPTAFNFHRFYVKARVALTGKDTENTWLNL